MRAEESTKSGETSRRRVARSGGSWRDCGRVKRGRGRGTEGGKVEGTELGVEEDGRRVVDGRTWE